VDSIMELMGECVSDFVSRCMNARAHAIETAAEKALQGGKFGVLVDEVRCIAYPHPSVPYGRIYVMADTGLERDATGWLVQPDAA
jgi:hypothetical protein